MKSKRRQNHEGVSLPPVVANRVSVVPLFQDYGTQYVQTKVAWCDRHLERLKLLVAQALALFIPRAANLHLMCARQMNTAKHAKSTAKSKSHFRKMLMKWEAQKALLKRL